MDEEHAELYEWRKGNWIVQKNQYPVSLGLANTVVWNYVLAGHFGKAAVWLWWTWLFSLGFWGSWYLLIDRGHFKYPYFKGVLQMAPNV